MENGSSTQEPGKGLSSEKREDIWSLIIATLILVISMAAPETVYDVFKNLLFFL
jgi:hypothetical protein